MACKFEVLYSAQTEIESIVAYLVTLMGGPSAAEAFVDELQEKIALASGSPKLFGFSRMPELAALGYRVFFVKNYAVLYFFSDDCVYIAHVFHQRQDYARLV